MSTALLGSTYFGPVEWYQKLNRYSHCTIERCDSFIKQTYRNRCIIATANGKQVLTVPVERFRQPLPDGSGFGEAMKMKDIRISDHGSWRHQHWQALCSAYGESPFFEFYQDDIRPFFERRWQYLYDFNMAITRKMCELLEIEPDIDESADFLNSDAASEQGISDFREVIRPKHAGNDPEFTPKRYYQVYQKPEEFLPNLSILDLLFNEGNCAQLYL